MTVGCLTASPFCKDSIMDGAIANMRFTGVRVETSAQCYVMD
jgi:hypothetical protein